MDKWKRHTQVVRGIQGQINKLYTQKKAHAKLASLKYRTKESFTIRTKGYKSGCHNIYCGALDQIIDIDPNKQIAHVEPRVSMEALVKAALPYGLIPPVIPELKMITVGGAIMGMGAESASHQWGSFNDACSSFDLIRGDGTLIKATPTENADLFYGVPGSYGSLGALALAELALIPAKECVHLKYHVFSNAQQALEKLHTCTSQPNPPLFLDAIIFSKTLAVVMEGGVEDKKNVTHLPHYRAEKPMFYQHVKEIAITNHSQPYQEWMTHPDYFFRYDPGAFWMGAYVLHFPLSLRLVKEGLWRTSRPKAEAFNDEEIAQFHRLPETNHRPYTFLRPLLSGKNLCKLLHQAETWIQNRFVIQDFCIPEHNAAHFLTAVCEDPAIFPIWLLPAKGTATPQIFAPHLLPHGKSNGRVVNFGIYGVPSHASPIKEVTKRLEQLTTSNGGRKALYARSYYDPGEFWKIYCHPSYEALREKTLAKGIWHEITAKVLSE